MSFGQLKGNFQVDYRSEAQERNLYYRNSFGNHQVLKVVRMNDIVQNM